MGDVMTLIRAAAVSLPLLLLAACEAEEADYQPMDAADWAPVAMGEGTWIHATDSMQVVLLTGMYWGRSQDLTAQGGIGVEHATAPSIPTVSGWGMIVMAVLLLTVGPFVLARRKVVAT